MSEDSNMIEPEKQSPEQSTEGEQGGFDDKHYPPDFIMKLLANPPLLPGESQAEFEMIFESFEHGSRMQGAILGRPKSDSEYLLVWQATTATCELIRWELMKVKVMAMQKRPAADAVYRKTFWALGEEDGDPADPEDALRQFGRKYFSTNPEFRKTFATRLEAAGYGASAVEAETFLRSLPTLSTIQKLIAGLERRLLNIIKLLDQKYAARDPEAEMPQSPAAKRDDPG